MLEVLQSFFILSMCTKHMMEQILRERSSHLRNRRDTSASICRLLTISQKMALVASHLTFPRFQ